MIIQQELICASLKLEKKNEKLKIRKAQEGNPKDGLTFPFPYVLGNIPAGDQAPMIYFMTLHEQKKTSEYEQNSTQFKLTVLRSITCICLRARDTVIGVQNTYYRTCLVVHNLEKNFEGVFA